MPRRSRMRRIAKWSGVLACVVLVAGWVVSGLVVINTPILLTGHVGIVDGWIEGSTDGSFPSIFKQSPPEWLLARGVSLVKYVPRSRRGWLPRVSESYRSEEVRMMYDVRTTAPRLVRYYFIPLWLPILVTALTTAYLFWRDRRFPRGHCQGCGYDLTGNESGVCPECGRAV